MVIATVMMCATTYQIGVPDVPQRFQPGDVAMNSELLFSHALRLSLINDVHLALQPCLYTVSDTLLPENIRH